MALTIKANNEKPLFELKESKNDKLIYKRVVKKNGNSKKEIQRRVNNLPTATVHVMSEDDFNRLKNIELELRQKMRFTIDDKKSLKDRILTFLEI